MKQFLLIVSIAALAIMMAAAQKPAGASGARISGKVTDDANADALAGVVVRVFVGGAVVTKAVTDPDGTYDISGLAVQESHVTYTRADYAPDDFDVTPTATKDVSLTKRSAPADYWKQEAMRINARINEAPERERQAAFTRNWEAFRSKAVSAEGKALVAQDLKELVGDKVWSGSSTVKIYASTDPERLAAAEQGAATDPRVLTLDPLIQHDMQASRTKLVMQDTCCGKQGSQVIAVPLLEDAGRKEDRSRMMSAPERPRVADKPPEE